MTHEKLAVVIPTYKRPGILKTLLTDLLSQTILPDVLVVVDGSPEMADVKYMLFEFHFPPCMAVLYIPSNHANAPYQRYLGYCIAKDCQWIIFIDDDIHFEQRDSIEKLIAPFMWIHRFIAGVTPNIEFPSRMKQNARSKGEFLEFLRSSYKLSPGELTPSGDRIPVADSFSDYVPVQWLRGGVMSFRREVISRVIYSEDVFALSHMQCGLGADDTYLSRCVSLYGELLFANCAVAEHPDSDVSRVFPATAKKLAFARAYSRRFLNDHYRLLGVPQWSDRMALAKSYVWSLFMNWANAIRSLNAVQFSYAWGYTLGVIFALVKKPTARNLTPEIDWQSDAQIALSYSVKIETLLP